MLRWRSGDTSGEILATGSLDASVRVWDAETKTSRGVPFLLPTNPFRSAKPGKHCHRVLPAPFLALTRGLTRLHTKAKETSMCTP